MFRGEPRAKSEPADSARLGQLLLTRLRAHAETRPRTWDRPHLSSRWLTASQSNRVGLKESQMGIIAPDRGGRNKYRGFLDKIFTNLTDQLSFAGSWIENHISKFIKKLHQPLADLHLRPYYGDEDETDGLYYSEVKRGTTTFHAYATLYARMTNKRFTLAVRRIEDGDTASSVLAEFLGVLDCGFYDSKHDEKRPRHPDGLATIT